MPTSLKSTIAIGGAGGHRVAPTDFPSTATSEPGLGKFSIRNIDVTNGAVALSLNGRYAIHRLNIKNAGTSGNNAAQVRLTIDGVDIFDKLVNLFSGTFVMNIWGDNDSTTSGGNSLCPLIVEESLELYIYNTTATAAEVEGIAIALPN